jgi:hypothetical protein
MPDDKTIDFVVAFLAIGLLTLSVGSWLLGWLVRTWDRVMSRISPAVLASPSNAAEHRSDAVGQSWNSAELSSGTSFRSVVEYLEQCDDDMLLDILAQLAGVDGDYRFAESRVAKFIPGRVEDRLAQVRAVRNTTPPPPPGRQLRVRDAEGERLIPMDA